MCSVQQQATSPEKRAMYLEALSYAQYTDDIFSVLQYALSSEVRLFFHPRGNDR